MALAGVIGGAGSCRGGGAEARGGGAEEEAVSHVRTVVRVAAVGSRAFEEGKLVPGAAAMAGAFRGGRWGGGRQLAEKTTAMGRRKRGRGGDIVLFFFLWSGKEELITAIGQFGG